MRRSRLDLWVAILEAVAAEEVISAGRVRSTRVQTAVNAPHDRFWGYLRELESRGLLATSPLRVTPAGRDFLAEAAFVHDFLNRFGLTLDAGGAKEPSAGQSDRPAENAPAGRAASLQGRRWFDSGVWAGGNRFATPSARANLPRTEAAAAGPAGTSPGRATDLPPPAGA